jgi:aryl-alcohol dehydrogenase-like predicted oxidoreductase
LELRRTASGAGVGRIGFGCFALSGGYGSAAGVDAARLARTALELGINAFDTSDAYAAGENERTVGAAIREVRDDVYLVTKFGWVLDRGGVPVRRDSSPAHVRRACEQSLARLDTDRIDLYLQHRRDPDTPVEDTVGELIRLRDEGKILGYGFCEVGAVTLGRAGRLWPVTALQTEYSLWSRDPEREVLPMCEREGIAFMAYSPLGRGFLTGRIRSTSELDASDFRRTHPRFQEENLSANLALVDRMRSMAEARQATAAQLALAWVLAQPWSIMPIVATRSAEHLAENVRALELRLSEPELETIAATVSPDLVKGERHPAEHMRTIES